MVKSIENIGNTLLIAGIVGVSILTIVPPKAEAQSWGDRFKYRGVVECTWSTFCEVKGWGWGFTRNNYICRSKYPDANYSEFQVNNGKFRVHCWKFI
jgi:hypothetical protein